MRRCVPSNFILAGMLVLLILLRSSSPSQSGPPASLQRPKLLIMLVIDQFRYDYLVRFRPYFVAGGFNLLLSGANFTDCEYDYASVVTCPGHASLFTGAYSNIHGIIGNDWYDSSLHRRVYCAEDSATRKVGGATGPGFSPRLLTGTTIGDELRMATDFQSKVIAISLKDRSSIITGGHTANAAYWYDEPTGRFVTSSYYMRVLPSWVAQFDDAGPAKAYCGKSWQALPETPGGGDRILEPFSAQPNEPCPSRRFLTWLHRTPFMNQIQLNLAVEAIKNERLGQGTVTDLLAVSLSVNDIIGHSFGPYSAEAADVTLRTDRDLADFFAKVDQIMGLNNVLITLSADHGVAPTPRFIEQHRLGIGKAPLDGAVKIAVSHGLSRAIGQDEWIEHVHDPYIYLNRDALRRHGIDAAKVETLAAEVAMALPGVQAAFTRTQFINGCLPHTPLAHKAANSFNARRSGDVFLVLEPFAVPVSEDTHTSHGSPWTYDSQVPLVFWGKAFRPGTYNVPCQPIDMVATLAAVLGLSPPSGSQGRPLVEALK